MIYSKKTSWGIIILLFILFLGSCLRFHGISREDLWLDEIISIQRATHPLLGIFNQSDMPMNIHYSYFIIDHVLLRIWMKFGQSPGYIRSLSACASILSIVLLYLLGKELFNRKIGLTAAFLISLSSLHIYYAQEARVYSVLMATALMATIFLIMALKTQQRKFWTGYIAITVIMVYLQALSIFMLIAFGLGSLYLVLILKKNPGWKSWLKAQVIIILFVLPYMVYMLIPKQGDPLNWIPKPTFSLVVSFYSYFSLGKGYQLFPSYIQTGFYILTLFLLGLTLFRKKSENSPAIYFTWTLFILPIVLLLIYSFKKPVFIPDRYTVISLPFFFLLLSYGLWQIPKSWLRNSIGLIITVILSWGVLNYYHEIFKIPWTKITGWLDTHPHSRGKTLMIYPDYWSLPVKYYLQNPMQIIPLDPMNNQPDKMNNLLNKEHSFWYISVADLVNKSNPSESIFIEKGYSAVTVMTLIQPSQTSLIYFEKN